MQKITALAATALAVAALAGGYYDFGPIKLKPGNKLAPI